MTTINQQNVPHEDDVRRVWVDQEYVFDDRRKAHVAFDAWLDEIRREALDGLIAWHRENAADPETPISIRRGIAVMADEAQRYRDTHYGNAE